jgi:hypothetical protein
LPETCVTMPLMLQPCTNCFAMPASPAPKGNSQLKFAAKLCRAS